MTDWNKGAPSEGRVFALILLEGDTTPKYIQWDKVQLRIGELEQTVASLQKTVIEDGEYLLDPDKVPSPEEQRRIVERAREEREKMKGKKKDV